MPAISKQKQLEDRFGKPITCVLQEAFSEHKTQSAVARALGVHQTTIWTWLDDLGLDVHVKLVPRAAKRDAGDGHTSPVGDGQLSFLG